MHKTHRLETDRDETALRYFTRILHEFVLIILPEVEILRRVKNASYGVLKILVRNDSVLV